ncbi:oligosaccharide flippase family protein [Hyphobacterium sp. CCMP332]|nr:oligosaccharide flippase family protein [Hyphobacterium sp. CCMP332]
MGIIKRQFFKASAATYVGVALGYLNVTILFPYFCSPEELGLYRVIINMATMFAAIAYMGTPQAIIKQFPFFNKKGQAKEFYGLLLIMFLTTLLISFTLLFLLENVVISFFKDKSPEVGEYYYYSVFIAFSLAVYVLFISNVRLIKRIAFPAFLKDVFLRLIIMGSIILLGFEFIDFRGFIMLLCGAYLSITLIGIVYSIKLVPFEVSLKIKNLKGIDIRDTLNFSLITFLASVSNIIIMNADSLMISALSKEGLADTGIYTIAFFIGSTLDIPRRIINLVTGPMIAEYWVDGSMDKIKDAFKETSINSLIIGCFIFGVIWINLESIYQLIPNSELYIKGINVVLFILLARLFEMSCSISPNILTQTKLYIYNLPLAILLVVLTVSLNYFLIPVYGILGAGFATMLSVIIYNSIKLIVIQIAFKINPFEVATLKVLFLFALIIALFYQLPEIENVFLSIALNSLIFSLLFVIPTYYFNFSRGFNQTIDNNLNQFKKYLNRK